MSNPTASQLAAELAALSAEQYAARKSGTASVTARFAAERPVFDADKFVADVMRRVSARLEASLGASGESATFGLFRGAGPAQSRHIEPDDDGEDDDDLTRADRIVLHDYMTDDPEVAAAARKALREFKTLARSPTACRFTSMGAARFVASHPEVVQACGGVGAFRGRR